MIIVKKIIIGILIISVAGLLAYILDYRIVKGNTDLLNPEEFIVIGHRGASAEAPEHTMEAYKLSQKLEADYIEIDLQMTKDGTLVAMHDERVDRTTNGTGDVANLNLSDIKKLDAGSWFNNTFPEKAKESYEGLEILTLDEIFQEFGSSANYYIEIKKPDENEGIELELLSLLKKHDLLGDSIFAGQVVVQSFSEVGLKKIHSLNPEIPLVKLEADEEIKAMDNKRLIEIRKYAVGVGAAYQKVDKDYLSAASDAGLLTHLFTVNKIEDLEVVKAMGANGIFSDDVKSIVPAIKKLD